MRLATFNVRDLLDDVSAVVETLRLLDADVVCLQEVPRHVVGDVRTLRLARAAGYCAARTHAFGGGTTLLWRPSVTLVELRHVPLRVPVGQRRRGVAVADVVADGVPARVASIHLGLYPVQRLRHAHHVVGLLGSGRCVVAGDANEPLDGPAVRRLGLEPLGRSHPTYPSWAPEHAIDVLLGRGWTRAVELDAPCVAGASDHLPRLVDITP